MKNLKMISYGILVILVIGGIYAFTHQELDLTNNISKNYTVQKTWKLPKDLNEVSGIAWLSENKIACVQDEDGIIFIYDINAGKILSEIDFAGNGDYEGSAINGNDAYVMRSDGVIFEVKDFQKSSKTTSNFKTGFSAKNNIESLTLNAKNGSLLMAPKDRDLNDEDFKGLYEIPIIEKKMVAEPLFKIDMNAAEFEDFKNKKSYKTFNPSDIAIDPLNGDIYILEGKNPKLLILDTKGNFKSLQELDKNEFPQPEGITFGSKGKLYISNEAQDGNATILEVKF